MFQTTRSIQHLLFLNSDTTQHMAGWTLCEVWDHSQWQILFGLKKKNMLVFRIWELTLLSAFHVRRDLAEWKSLRTTGLLPTSKTTAPAKGGTKLQKTEVDTHLFVGLKAALLNLYYSRDPEIIINLTWTKDTCQDQAWNWEHRHAWEWQEPRWGHSRMTC